jgi:hypothetical protein
LCGDVEFFGYRRLVLETGGNIVHSSVCTGTQDVS